MDVVQVRFFSGCGWIQNLLEGAVPGAVLTLRRLCLYNMLLHYDHLPYIRYKILYAVYNYGCITYFFNIWVCANTSRARSCKGYLKISGCSECAQLECTLRRLHVQPRDLSRMRTDWSPGWPGFAIFYTISKVTSFTSLVFFYISYNDRWVINKLH